MRPFLAYRQSNYFMPGCLQGAIIHLFCLSVCATFWEFTDCESYTRPISTNPGSMEAGEYWLTRGTCLVACRLEVVVVAGLLWMSWCVLGAAGFRFFYFPFFFLERIRPAPSMRPPCFIYLLTSITELDAQRFIYDRMVFAVFVRILN